VTPPGLAAGQDGESAGRAEIRETHSAVVTLVGDRAYKFKKAVNLGFLDFSSEASRHAVCARELELNRRLAPDVYLDTISLVGSAGATLEHGLLMRRLPESARLSTLLSTNAPVGEHLRAIARLLARFHASAERGPEIDAEAGPIGLRRRWRDNLAETIRHRGTTFTESQYDQISKLALTYVEGREPLLADRVARGLMVDGHGDLIADDVFCLSDYPRVIDCLEFDDRLRWVDVLDDICFLAMDLEHLGHPELGQYLLDRYREFSDTPLSVSLEHHFIAYRAFVRAKVTAIQAEQGRVGAAREAAEYADLALRHLKAAEVTLTVVCGPPGTGKTTLAEALADRRGDVLVSSDAVRRDLALPAEIRYREEAKAAVYQATLRHARLALERGESVVADATWSQPAARELARQVARDTSSRLVVLQCTVPDALAAARSQRRLEAGTSLSEAGADVARQLAARWPPWPEATVIDMSGSVAWALEAALAAMSANAVEQAAHRAQESV
jgi:aminoglycoside phosphotransferase family enzyme/predicted kinase